MDSKPWLTDWLTDRQLPSDLAQSVSLNMAAARSSETSVSYHNITGHRKAEYYDLNLHRRENSESRIVYFLAEHDRQRDY